MYQVEHAAESLRGEHEMWLSFFSLATMGNSLWGYGQHLVTLEGGEPAQEELFSAIESSGLWNTKDQMLRATRKMLEKFASDKLTLIWAMDFTVRNYSDRARFEWKRKKKFKAEKRRQRRQGR